MKTVKKSNGIDYVSTLIKENESLQMKLVQKFIALLSHLSADRAAKFATELFLRPQSRNVSKDQKIFYQKAFAFHKKIGKQKIFIRTTSPYPSVLLVHGWGSSSLRFQEMVEYFEELGIDCMVFDLPAHGQSTGKSTNIVEVNEVIQNLLRRYPTIDTLIGHSFGGAAALIKGDTPKYLRRIITIGSAFDLEYYTTMFFKLLKIPDIIQPLFYEYLESKLGCTISQITPLNQSLPSSLSLFLIHDKDDIVVSHTNTLRFARSHPNTQVMITEGLGHRQIVKSQAVMGQIVTLIHKKEKQEQSIGSIPLRN